MGVITRSFPPHLYPVEYFVLLHGASPLPPGERGVILKSTYPPSPLMGEGEGPAPHRVQDLALNLTWVRVGVKCPFYLGVVPILLTRQDK